MKYKIFLFLILLIGVFLRFYRITEVPPSLSHDEVAIAYNAYSILKTGKDEYGEKLPLLFRSFDDYKLPGMVYATIPSQMLFGRSLLGARFTSSILGSFTIFVLYFLVYELVRYKKSAEVYGLAAAFMFAISPWHINFSRQLFESNGHTYLQIVLYA